MTSPRERPNDRWQVSPRAATGSRRRTGLHVGPIRITPLRASLAIALVGAGLFNLVAVLVVRDERQIPMLSSGFLVMGLALGALAVGAAIETWRAGADGRSGQAFAFALAGGVAGLAAAGCFAGAVILALLWGG
jgi:hypothetical protein